MSGTSAAKPDNLTKFVNQAEPATTTMAAQVKALAQQVATYTSLPTDYSFANGGAIASQATQYVSDNAKDEKFVATVRDAFTHADSTTLSDGVISSALSAAGVGPSARQAITIDQPTFKGKPLDSGFSDDPVCTATGHFLEQERDLVMPDALRVLTFERTYSSRFIAPSSFGRAWYGWADTRLVRDGDALAYQGPDGQVATFLVDSTTVLPNSSVGAKVTIADGEHRMRWAWTARHPGMTWTFATDGRLIRIDDPFGGATTADHDSEGRLAALTHEGGRRVELRWKDGRVVGLASSDGRTVSYHYGSGPDLERVERNLGEERYDVDADGRILTVTDADGVRLVANTYDDDGRVLSQTSPFGRTSHYRYLAPLTVVVNDDDGGPSTLFRHDPNGRLVELLSAAGTRSTRHFDEHGNPVRVVDFDGSITDRMFDLGGNCVLQRTPDGAEERWAYDAAGRVVRHTTTAGATTTWTYRGDEAWPAVEDGPHGARTTYESRHGMPTRSVDPDGVGATLGRDADGVIVAVANDLGHTTRITPHPTGRPAIIETPSGDRWHYEVDGAGRVLSATSPLGHRTEQRWSPAGRLLATVDSDGATVFERGPHGMAESVVYPSGERTTGVWDRLGQISSVHLADGSTWQLDRDPQMQLAAVTGPDGARWTWDHDAAGHLERTTDPDGGQWNFGHDAGGRVTSRTSPAGARVEIDRNDDGLPIALTNDVGGRLTTSLDPAGRPLEIRVDGRPRLRWSWSPAGRPWAATLPDGTSWRWSYDGAGRPTEVTNPAGGITTLRWDDDGRLTSTTDATGGTIAQTWDADGRLVELTEDGAATRLSRDGKGRITRYERPGSAPCHFAFDAGGRLTTTIDGLGAATRLDWSEDGSEVRVAGDAGRARTLRWDRNGQLIGAVDPLGRVTSFERDAQGRERTRRLADGTTLHLSWDADGVLSGIADERRPLLVSTGGDDAAAPRTQRTSGPGGDHEVTWDSQGRRLRTVSGGRTTSYHHDDDAGTIAVDLPGQTAGGVWSYDAAGQLVSVDVDGLGRVHLLRDAAGRLIGAEGPGLSRRWARDRMGRVVGYTEAIGDRLQVVEIGRDAAGRVVTERSPDGDRRFRYDDAGQLVGCNDDTWAYDGLGRLVAETVGGRVRRFSYDHADQLLTMEDEGGVTTYRYDRCGRRVAEDGPAGTVRYRWDELGRLAGIARDGQETVVLTDPLGRLRGVGNVPVDWSEGGPQGDAAAAIDGRGVIGVEGVPLARTGGAGGPEWISADWRGSVGIVDPWGRPEDPGVALGFLGEVTFEGLVWLRHRVYDPATKAFLSPDPLTGVPGLPGALTNPYTYAGNDPIGLVDPSGRQPLSMAQAQAMMKGWRQNHIGEIVVGTLAIAGAVTLCVVTGGAAAPLIIGAALGAGSTLLTDEIEHKPIDWYGVYMNAGVGAFMGTAGAAGTAGEDSAITTLTSKLPDSIAPALAKPMVQQAVLGTTTSFIEGEATNPGNVLGNLEGAGISGATSAVFAPLSFSKSFMSGGLDSAGVDALRTSDPGRYAEIVNSTRNANLAMAPKLAIAKSLVSDGTSHIPGPSQYQAPAGVSPSGPMTSAQLQAYVKAGG